MSEGLPKSARDVLAKQTMGDAHLSPDLLNAYVEQSLSDDENGVVLAHLATCSDCREVVFLTSEAAQEELLAAKQASPQVVMASVRMGARTADAAPAPTMAQPARMPNVGSRPKPPRRWWKWALPVAAVIVATVGVLERDNILQMVSPPATEMAKVERPSVATSQPSTPPANSESRADQTQNQPTVAQNTNALLPPPAQKKELAERDHLFQQQQSAHMQREQAELSSNSARSKDKRETASAGALGMPVATPPSEPKAAAPASADSTTQLEAALAAGTPNGGNDITYAPPDLKPNSLAKSAMPGNGYGALGVAAQRAAPTRWRISSDGHVEHTVGPSTWERVMSAEPVTFHVVATVGENVWAGGSDGALFHSSDGGREWSRVGLAGEQGTIKSIHFNNAQQGSVTTEAGAVWTTSDGGFTWSKQ